MDILYTQNTADKGNIQDHFKSCDSDFIKDLSSRVDLDQYIDKLLSKSVRYEAWSGNALIGILAVYHGHEFDFITNVSVSQNFAKRGVGSRLVQECIDKASNKELKLEVSKGNAAGLGLYEKFGFVIEREDDMSYYLSLIVK